MPCTTVYFEQILCSISKVGIQLAYVTFLRENVYCKMMNDGGNCLCLLFENAKKKMISMYFLSQFHKNKTLKCIITE